MCDEKIDINFVNNQNERLGQPGLPGNFNTPDNTNWNQPQNSQGYHPPQNQNQNFGYPPQGNNPYQNQNQGYPQQQQNNPYQPNPQINQGFPQQSNNPYQQNQGNQGFPQNNNTYQGQQSYPPQNNNPYHPQTNQGYQQTNQPYQSVNQQQPQTNVVVLSMDEPNVCGNRVPILDTGVAIIILVINILFPGLGTMIVGCIGGGSTNCFAWFCIGFLQLFLFPVFLIGWIWSIMTGIMVVSRSGSQTHVIVHSTSPR